MKRTVAIEVTPSFVRGVEIDNPLTANPSVVASGTVALPPGAATESEIFDQPAVVDAFAELWREFRFSTRSVTVGVGGRKILIRNFETPTADIDKIRAKLRFEASNLLPSQMSDAILDFYPVELSQAESGLEIVKGLLIAASKEPVEQLVSTAQQAGLSVMAVDYLPFGLARAARKAFGVSGEYILVNIKPWSTDIVALKNGVPQMVRMIPNGLKKTGKTEDQSLSGENSEIDPIDSIVAGIRNTINYYNSNGGNTGALLIAGEGSLNAELQERLPQELQLRAGLLSLEDVISIDHRTAQLEGADKAGFISAVGVGMRGLKG